MEKVHAETIRKDVKALEVLREDVPEIEGLGAEAFVGPTPPGDTEDILLGPVLPDAVEEDPYNLPITHEVALEGNPNAK